MKFSDSSILKFVKVLLAKKFDNFSIKLLIDVLQTTEVGGTYHLSKELVKAKYPNLTRDELSSFLKRPSFTGFCINPNDSSAGDSEIMCVLTVSSSVFYLQLPKRLGRKQIVTKSELSAKLINDSFDLWFKYIGSDKNVYKKTPTLTKSRFGRMYWIQKAYEQNFVSSLLEFELAVKGCATSPYHMGFNKDGTRSTHKYCEPKSIFRNSQRVQEMIARSDGVHYSVKLNEIEDRKEKLSKVDEMTSLSTDIEISEEDYEAKVRSGELW